MSWRAPGGLWLLPAQGLQCLQRNRHRTTGDNHGRDHFPRVVLRSGWLARFPRALWARPRGRAVGAALREHAAREAIGADPGARSRRLAGRSRRLAPPPENGSIDHERPQASVTQPAPAAEARAPSITSCTLSASANVGT